MKESADGRGKWLRALLPPGIPRRQRQQVDSDTPGQPNAASACSEDSGTIAIIPNALFGGPSMALLKLRFAVRLVALAGFLLLCGMQTAISQSPTASSAAASVVKVKDFAGTWNWMFKDKRFATMTLEQDGDRLTGTMTNGHIDMDDSGKITNASSATGSTSIVKTTMENGRLILLAKDGENETEFAMTLTSPSTAELRFRGDGAPALVQPIRLEKVWSEPPVEK
jgi:hypothetical protein